MCWISWFSRHAEVDCSLSCGEGVELGEFVAGCGEADVESVEFTEPAFMVGFGDAVEEVVMDLDQPGPVSGVGRRSGQRMHACSWMHGVA